MIDGDERSRNPGGTGLIFSVTGVENMATCQESPGTEPRSGSGYESNGGSSIHMRETGSTGIRKSDRGYTGRRYSHDNQKPQVSLVKKTSGQGKRAGTPPPPPLQQQSRVKVISEGVQRPGNASPT
eukprot:GHVR01114107.1.p1 GENE.GHVR01114107.1~~GHVR01114107.1.p1  ORF type:complete len:126 (+),score=10.87 GHVR01114107.1:130-507(+)